ncbi:TonB-dependent receptor [Komagataeibacter sp. AV436]|uniref:TonB-dependent receptor n=1 Tax=Komagataeibacter melomenusus TaxID=2766578 RepID=A0ABX2ACP7_9PROT|nr:TonB-dependent receptor [Komagataeibacter melomenusus]NPC66128.1 TonB-dependent receptor [Komagataeibacter melomenusus]
MRFCSFGALVLSTTVLSGLIAAEHSDAQAATPSATARNRPARVHVGPRPQPDTRPTGVAARGDGETIHVSTGIRTPNGVTGTTPGGGLMPVQTVPKARSEVTRDFIAKQSSNTTPQALVAMMPGVAYARTDPYGLTSRALVVRGMNQSEIGYLVDGVPLVDGVYYQPDSIGSSPDAENMSSVSLTQGSPDITSPSYNAVGSSVDVTLRDPSSHRGGMIESSYGSYHMKKEFVRFDTGEIGHTGIRAFMSYSYMFSNFWQTPGSINRHHVDAKLVKEWGQGNRVAVEMIFGQYSSSGINSNGAATPTKAAFEAEGTSALYLSPNYTPGSADYYRMNRLMNKTIAVMAPMKFNLGHELNLHVTPYFINWDKDSGFGENINDSQAYLGTQNVGALNLPTAVTLANGTKVDTTQVVDEQHQHTLALMGHLDWKHRNNLFRIGSMYSYLDMVEPANYAAVGPDGLPANAWGRYSIKDAAGQALSPWNLVFRQQQVSIYFDDTLSLLNDRLKLTAGFKEVMINRWATNDLPGIPDRKNGGNYAEPLPQVAISYNITKHDQIFVNGTTSFRAPDRTEAYLDMYDAKSPSPIDVHPQNLKPEYAIGEEIGFRHNGLVHIAASLFNYNLTNHDVNSTAYSAGGSLVTTPINMGGETVRGAQLEIGLRPWHHFSPYLSGSYVHATTDNNFQIDGTYIDTRGKRSVNTPEFTGAVGLSYDDGTFFGNFGLNYIGKRYTTFMNDQDIPGYLTSDITLGYRLHNVRIDKFMVYKPQFQLNFMNIGNNLYYAQAASFTPTAKGVRAANGQWIAAGQPGYNIGGGFAMSGALTVGF